jgi:hypothetical protein
MAGLSFLSRKITARDPHRVLALVVLAMIVADIAGCVLCGFRVTGVMSTAAQLVLLGCVGGLYFWFRNDARLLEMGIYVALWVCFSFAAAVLTYLGALSPAPLSDGMWAACDRGLHFDMHAYSRLLVSHPILYEVMRIDHGSLIVQIAGSVLLFAHWRVAGRNAAFLSAAIISLLLCAGLAAWLPALGPPAGVDAAFPNGAPWVADVLGMRAGGHITRSLAELQGIVTFPSYHTVLAVLIVWAHRGLPTFWPALVVNGLMLVSVPPAGNHYLTDMIGGAAVVALAIAATSRVAFAR